MSHPAATAFFWAIIDGQTDAGDHGTTLVTHGVLGRRPSRIVMFPPRLPPTTALILGLRAPPSRASSVLTNATMNSSSKSTIGVFLQATFVTGEMDSGLMLSA